MSENIEDKIKEQKDLIASLRKAKDDFDDAVEDLKILTNSLPIGHLLRSDGERKIVVNTVYGGFSVSNELKRKYVEISGKQFKNIERDDPLFVKLVEELGPNRSGGKNGYLRVISIPNDVDWEVGDYDGIEYIQERARRWDPPQDMHRSFEEEFEVLAIEEDWANQSNLNPTRDFHAERIRILTSDPCISNHAVREELNRHRDVRDFPTLMAIKTRVKEEWRQQNQSMAHLIF